MFLFSEALQNFIIGWNRFCAPRNASNTRFYFVSQNLYKQCKYNHLNFMSLKIFVIYWLHLEGRWDGVCGKNGGEGKYLQVLVGKVEGKRLHENPKRRRDDDVRVDIFEMEWHVLSCIYRVQN
jgi:hypothetical protein